MDYISRYARTFWSQEFLCGRLRRLERKNLLGRSR